MKKLLVVLLAAVLLLPQLPARAEGVVNVFNWEDYINPEAIALFEEETGIKVNYMRFTTNEDMMVQVRSNPAAFDVLFPSDYVIERLIKEDQCYNCTNTVIDLNPIEEREDITAQENNCRTAKND